MLLANISVAQKIKQEFPEFAVLRRHPQPPPSNFEPLIKAASLKVIPLGFCIYVILISHFCSLHRVCISRLTVERLCLSP